MTGKSLKTLLEEHHDMAYRWARQCCYYNEELTREVMQIVYLKVLEGSADFNGRSTFKTWLFSVIRFTAIDEMRFAGKWVPLEEADVEITSEILPDRDDYHKIIKRLPARQSEILLLVFYHNLTLEESSGIMGITLGTARTHYDRGKKNLKKMLDNETKTCER